MRILQINEENKEKVRRVLEFASDPKNLYVVGAGGVSEQKPPGDNPSYVAVLDAFRCVFSFTKTSVDGKIWRHVSISVPADRGMLPHPIAAFAIATMFGFTGWDGESMKPPIHWAGTVDHSTNAVVLFEQKTEVN